MSCGIKRFTMRVVLSLSDKDVKGTSMGGKSAGQT